MASRQKSIIKMKLLATTLFLISLTNHSSAVGPLSVTGNKVLINGKSGVLRGNSLFWSNTGWGCETFYNADIVNWLRDDWKASVIRAPVGIEDYGGYLSEPDANKNRVITVVDAAIKADIYVIIDWHSHNAHQQQSEAIAFFQEMARKYGHYNNVIYEIFNEPKNDVTWSQHVKPYAVAVIKAIRDIDPDNLIVVGTTFWSQDVDIAASDPITGYKNIAYTLHFYAGTHGQFLRDKAIIALKKNIALFVTEWGTVSADSATRFDRDESNRWIKFLTENKISHCNWSVCDKPEGPSILKPGTSRGGNWTASALTESGTYVNDLLKSF